MGLIKLRLIKLAIARQKCFTFSQKRIMMKKTLKRRVDCGASQRELPGRPVLEAA